MSNTCNDIIATESKLENATESKLEIATESKLEIATESKDNETKIVNTDGAPTEHKQNGLQKYNNDYNIYYCTECFCHIICLPCKICCCVYCSANGIFCCMFQSIVCIATCGYCRGFNSYKQCCDNLKEIEDATYDYMFSCNLCIRNTSVCCIGCLKFPVEREYEENYEIARCKRCCNMILACPVQLCTACYCTECCDKYCNGLCQRICGCIDFSKLCCRQIYTSCYCPKCCDKYCNGLCQCICGCVDFSKLCCRRLCHSKLEQPNRERMQ
jgi:hypothetical protein